MTFLHDQECGVPCVKKDCTGHCDWVSIHNTDDGLHLCWRHIKEYEDELEEQLSGYKGADHD